MANTITVKTGLEINRANITPAEGELIYAKDTKLLYVGDGVSAGGKTIGTFGGGSVRNASGAIIVLVQ